MSLMSISSRPRTFIAAAIVGSLGVGIAVGAIAAQPHMTAARGFLDQALGELQAAEADKGGHRVKAMGLIRDAIAQVNMGIGAGG